MHPDEGLVVLLGAFGHGATKAHSGWASSLGLTSGTDAGAAPGDGALPRAVPDGQTRAPSASKALWLGAASAVALVIAMLVGRARLGTGARVLAVAKLSVGMIAVAFILGALALVFGIRARLQLRRNPLLSGKGSANFGIIVGCVMLLVLATVAPLLFFVIMRH